MRNSKPLDGNIAKYIILGICVIPAGIAASENSLVFANQKVEVHTTPGQQLATIKFDFSNRSAKSIRLINAEVSCGCTTYTFSSREVLPHGSGSILMTIDISKRGDRRGRSAETLLLYTDEKSSAPYRLVGAINSAGGIVITPRILKWRIGEVADFKFVRIRIPMEVAGAKTGDATVEVKSIYPQFSATVQTTTQPGVFLLSVSPQGTADAAYGRIKILVHNVLMPDIYVLVSR